jgi:hypothetical protein
MTNGSTAPHPPAKTAVAPPPGGPSVALPTWQRIGKSTVLGTIEAKRRGF